MAFGSTDEALALGLGRPFAFCFDTNSVGGVGGDGRVVRGHWKEERVEGMAVGGHIVCYVVDEAGETVGASRNVDGLQEVGERFAKMLDVIVGRLAEDGWKGGSELTEEVFHIVRCGHGCCS